MQTVFIVKGPKGHPATITTWPKVHASLTRQQFLGPDEIERMGKDSTALYKAEMIDDIWRMKEYLDKAPDVEREVEECPF